MRVKYFESGGRLHALCERYYKIKNNIVIDENENEEIFEQIYFEAEKIEKSLLRDAKEEIRKNFLKYKDYLFNVNNLFYFKKQNNYVTFSKEFLQIPEVKLNKNKLIKVAFKEIQIEELDSITKEYTNGKFETLYRYLWGAIANMELKLSNKIAIDKIAEMIIEECKKIKKIK